MPQPRHTLTRFGAEIAWGTGLTHILRHALPVRGIILALERVLPEDPADFAPNATRQIKPDYLRAVVLRLRKLGYETVSLDEAMTRLDTDGAKPFVVVTFDGAYRDAARHALPLLRQLRCPYAIYVPTAWADGVGMIWWQVIEDIVATQSAIAVTYLGDTEYLPAGSLEEKRTAYAELHARLSRMGEADRLAVVRELAEQYGHDTAEACRELVLDWPELATIASDPLCTMGSMTVTAGDLSQMAPPVIRNEIEQANHILAAQLGEPPRHLAYAGEVDARATRIFAEAGLHSAVTRRTGPVTNAHRTERYALPRVPLRGDWQSRRLIDVLAAPGLLPLLGY
ncbi:polysaccharide deacetylase family protein [Devosia sp.]|uniref:polysaccharide deacetylase family protein n=1 Tax=Devosia sp. TaxID=1871048 RepID=UPI003A907285